MNLVKVKIDLSLSEDMNFYFFDFNYFRQFYGFFYLYLIQKTNDFSIYKMISSAFDLLSFQIGC